MLLKGNEIGISGGCCAKICETGGLRTKCLQDKTEIEITATVGIKTLKTVTTVKTTSNIHLKMSTAAAPYGDEVEDVASND